MGNEKLTCANKCNHFKRLYLGACASRSVQPLPMVINHSEDNILNVDVLRVKKCDWPPLLDVLNASNSLVYISLKCNTTFQNRGSQISISRRPSCTANFNAMTRRNLCRALRSTLKTTKSLTFVELFSLQFSALEIKCLCEGIAQNQTLKHLSMEGSTVGDSGFLDLCQALRYSKQLVALNVSRCRITHYGIAGLAELIQFQGTQRHSAAWQDTLRYQHPIFDQSGGIRRITLNDNPGIGDLGSIRLARILEDDLWIKAIDLQGCDITDEGANVWLHVLVGPPHVTSSSGDHFVGKEKNRGNQVLVVLDLRRNPRISRNLLRIVTERVLINSEGKQIEYNWLSTQSSNERKGQFNSDQWPGQTGFIKPIQQKRCSRKPPLSQKSAPASDVQGPSDRRRRSSSAHQSLASVRLGPGQKSPIRRSRSLTNHRESARFSGTDHATGDHRPKAAWRPPGRCQPIPVRSPVRQATRPKTSDGDVAPWRTAVRALHCCRGHPPDQCPKHTCYTHKHVIPHNERPIRSPVTHTSRYPRAFWESQNKVGQSALQKRPATSRVPYTNQNKQKEMQAQLHKLMLRVSYLEKELQREKMKNRKKVTEPCKSETNSTKISSVPLLKDKEITQIKSETVLDVGMIKPLGQLVLQLQSLLEKTKDIEEKKNIPAELVFNSYLDKLRRNQTRQHTITGQETSNLVSPIPTTGDDKTTMRSKVADAAISSRRLTSFKLGELNSLGRIIIAESQPATRIPMEAIEQDLTLCQGAICMTHSNESTSFNKVANGIAIHTHAKQVSTQLNSELAPLHARQSSDTLAQLESKQFTCDSQDLGKSTIRSAESIHYREPDAREPTAPEIIQSQNEHSNEANGNPTKSHRRESPQIISDDEECIQLWSKRAQSSTPVQQILEDNNNALQREDNQQGRQLNFGGSKQQISLDRTDDGHMDDPFGECSSLSDLDCTDPVDLEDLESDMSFST